MFLKITATSSLRGKGLQTKGVKQFANIFIAAEIWGVCVETDFEDSRPRL